MRFSLSQLSLSEVPNKREKLIFFAVIFVFFVFFARSCWMPSRMAISQLENDIKSLKGEKALQDNIPESAAAGTPPSADKAFVEVPEKYGEWAGRFALNPDSVLMVEFSNPAIARNIVLSDIQFSDEGVKFKGDGIVGRGFKISLYGPFMSVGFYLERLEDLPILLNIDTILLNSIEGENGRVNAEITGTAYGWK